MVRNLTSGNRTQSMSSWAKELGVSIQLIKNRIDLCGWSEEEALTSERFKGPKGCNKHKDPIFKKAYDTWKDMRRRCAYPTGRNKAYEGIKICARWQNDFYAFLEDMGLPRKQQVIDRVDNSKGYSPKNCRWVSSGESSLNRRVTVWLTFKGKKQCMTSWAKEYGVPVPTLHNRLKRGWPLKKALQSKRFNRWEKK
jgi:hypothetical protein